MVARFLGLLELYREGLLAFEQVEALGDLHVRWTGEGRADGAEYDGAEYDGSQSASTDTGGQVGHPVRADGGQEQ